jgi:outer membrane receptor protein involved in Fe transport
MLKVDGFVSRSLFDLWSNFTFYLNDPVHGDEIQQHDSRLQEGLNAQYLHIHKLFNQPAILTFGGNFHDNHINVGTFNTDDRKVLVAQSSDHVHVTNAAGYLQEGVTFWRGRLHAEAGLRFDSFRFQSASFINPAQSGAQTVVVLQPKVNLSYTPTQRLPLTLYFNYGRGISSQDARGIILHPQSPKVSTTDFFQWGASYHRGRISGTADWFLIDRSNEQVYIPDDGSIEFKGPTCSYGWEAKTAIRLTRALVLNGGITAVSNAYYRDTFPRVYVDSAPHVVGNAALSLSDWRGFSGSVRYRYGNHYRLTDDGPLVLASGFGVVDFSMSKRLRRNMELSFSIDNLTNKQFYETQNYFESRVTPTSPVITRIHATPGYPVSATIGMRFYFVGK